MKSIFKRIISGWVAVVMVMTYVPVVDVAKAEGASEEQQQIVIIPTGTAVGTDTEGFVVFGSDNTGFMAGDYPFNSDTVKTSDGIEYSFVNSHFEGNDCIKISEIGSTTMNLQTIGAYKNIYVLAVAGGINPTTHSNFAVTLTYTDGSKDLENYSLYDWCMAENGSNLPTDAGYTDGFYRYYDETRKDTDYIGKNVRLYSKNIPSDPSKLLKSITFQNSSSGITCAVFAVTGVTTAKVPSAPTNLNVSITDDGFTASWTAPLENVDGYYIDVATDENFLNMISSYNNKKIESKDVTTQKITGLTAGQNYYCRVRAYNGNGQSLSSEVAAVSLAALPNLTSILLPNLVQKENGTSLDNIASSLPSEVTINTRLNDDKDTVQTGVTWDTSGGLKALDGNSYTYISSSKEQQVFTIDGKVTIPDDVTNTHGVSLEIKIYVLVNAAGVETAKEEEILVKIDQLNTVIEPNGTTKEDLGLPELVDIETLKLESSFDSTTMKVTRNVTKQKHSGCAVYWALDTISYDPANESHQDFTVIGEVILPQGITASSSLEAKVSVVVLAKDVILPDSLGFVDVSIQEIITVPNGTAISDFGLPSTVKITWGPQTSETSQNVDVVWDTDSINYDPSLKTQQTIEISGSIALPEVVKTATGLDSIKNKIYVIVSAEEKINTETENNENSEKPSIENENNSENNNSTPENSGSSSNSGPVFPSEVIPDDISTIPEYTDGIFEKWVQVSFSGDKSHKFGIRAANGIIEDGSTFSVEMIEPNHPNYTDYSEMLDKDITIENVQYLDISIKKPDGTKYKELASNAEIFMQWPDGWDKEDQHLVRLLEGSDVQRQFLGFNEIEGVTYARYAFPNFSPYALIDKLNNQDIHEKWWQDNTNWIVWLCILLFLAIAGTSYYFFYYKKRSRKV